MDTDTFFAFFEGLSILISTFCVCTDGLKRVDKED